MRELWSVCCSRGSIDRRCDILSKSSLITGVWRQVSGAYQQSSDIRHDINNKAAYSRGRARP